MAVIDTRNKNSNGNTVVTFTDEQRLVFLARNTPANLIRVKANSKIPKKSRKNSLTGTGKSGKVATKKPVTKKKEEEPVVPDHHLSRVCTCIERFPDVIKPVSPDNSPTNFDGGKDINISVAGLGATKRFKGKTFLLEVMRYSDPAGASDAALKKQHHIPASTSVNVDEL